MSGRTSIEIAEQVCRAVPRASACWEGFPEVLSHLVALVDGLNVCVGVDEIRGLVLVLRKATCKGAHNTADAIGLLAIPAATPASL